MRRHHLCNNIRRGLRFFLISEHVPATAGRPGTTAPFLHPPKGFNPTAPRGRVDFFPIECYNTLVNVDSAGQRLGRVAHSAEGATIIRKAYGEQIFRSAFREPPAGARRQPARRTAIPGGGIPPVLRAGNGAAVAPLAAHEGADQLQACADLSIRVVPRSASFRP